MCPYLACDGYNCDMPFITQANDSAAAKRQEAGPKRGPGRPRINRRGDELDVGAVEATEDSSRVAGVVEVLQECMRDPNPDSALELIHEGDDPTQVGTAADIPATQTAEVPATPMATAPLLRVSTQVSMWCVALPASPSVCSDRVYACQYVGVVWC